MQTKKSNKATKAPTYTATYVKRLKQELEEEKSVVDNAMQTIYSLNKNIAILQADNKILRLEMNTKFYERLQFNPYNETKLFFAKN